MMARPLTPTQASVIGKKGAAIREKNREEVKSRKQYKKDFRETYYRCEVQHKLENHPIEVLALLMNGRTPTPTEHPFLKYLNTVDKRYKEKPSWWWRVMTRGEKLLCEQPVTLEMQMQAAKELLKYMYPQLKAVDLKTGDGSMQPILNMMLGDGMSEVLEKQKENFGIEDEEEAEIVDPE